MVQAPKSSGSWLLAMLGIAILLGGCNGASDATPIPPTEIVAPPPSPTNIPPSPTFTPTIELPTATVSSPPVALITPVPVEYESPAWFREAILYEVFVRSFSDADGDGIGDLQGVTDRLDHIQSLGVTAIWLMPIHPSPSVHGYDVIDYLGVNPDYGTLQDLQELVAAAHEREIRVLIDFVPSHLSSQHPFFQDALGNPESEYRDWFLWKNEEHTEYAGFAGLAEMPHFNHAHQEVVDFLIQAALFWLDLDQDGDYTDGVDGFRVDHAKFPPKEFTIALRHSVKTVNPAAVLLGEVWVNSPGDLSTFFTDQFDALFDFPLYSLLQGDHNSNLDGLLAGKGFPDLISSLIEEETDRFPPEGIPVRFISNHDTNRVATEMDGNMDRQRLAASILAALPGPVKVYYGEEIGMRGQKGDAPAFDNYRREPMDWYANEVGLGQTTWFRPDDRWNAPLDGISVEEQESADDSLLNHYRRVLALRKAHPALQSGSYIPIMVQTSGIGVWGFIREADDEALLVVVNLSKDPRGVTLTAPAFLESRVVDLFTGDSYPAGQSGEAYSFTINPITMLILNGG